MYIQNAVFSIFEYLNIQNKAVYQIDNKGMINDLLEQSKLELVLEYN